MITSFSILGELLQKNVLIFQCDNEGFLCASVTPWKMDNFELDAYYQINSGDIRVL